MTRRPTAVLLVGVLLVLAVLGLARSAGVGGPPSPDERAQAISESLRCPTCQGLSVADSNSPLAKSMRRIVTERVAAGQSAEEVRGYFTDRYGAWVLLSPRAQGSGWLVWAVPVVVLLVGLAVAGHRIGRRVGAPADRGAGHGADHGVRRRLGSQPVRWAAVGTTLAVALAVLMAVTMDTREDGELVTGTVPQPVGAQARSSDPSPAADASGADRLEELRAAVRRTPEDPRTRLALASTAFELGRFDVVRAQAGAVLDRQPRNVDALLLRGLAPSSPGDSAARRSLRRFVDLAPAQHPGRPLAEEILGGER